MESATLTLVFGYKEGDKKCRAPHKIEMSVAPFNGMADVEKRRPWWEHQVAKYISLFPEENIIHMAMTTPDPEKSGHVKLLYTWPESTAYVAKVCSAT